MPATPRTLGKLSGAMLALGALTACGLGDPEDRDWPAHGGNAGHTQYSPLDQITPENVNRLQVAWTYRTGDARENGRSQIQCNPIVVHGVLYGTSPQLKVFAVNAATGEERWVFDPFESDSEEHALGVNRGLVYWESGEDQRILVAAGQRLYALDAMTGRPIPGFGEGGSVSLKTGLGPRAQELYVLSNTPGAIYEDLLSGESSRAGRQGSSQASGIRGQRLGRAAVRVNPGRLAGSTDTVLQWLRSRPVIVSSSSISDRNM